MICNVVGVTVECNEPAVAFVTQGCVHEHLHEQQPTCRKHLDNPGKLYCHYCWNADRHNCELVVFSVEMVANVRR